MEKPQRDRWGPYKPLSGHEVPGQCWWCGTPVKNRRYCSQHCRDSYRDTFNWGFAVEAALKRAQYRCQDCPLEVPPGPKYVLSADGKTWYQRTSLVVHHHIPLPPGDPRLWHPLNHPENLVVLCRSCHGKRHSKPLEERESLKGPEKRQLLIQHSPFHQSRLDGTNEMQYRRWVAKFHRCHGRKCPLI